MQTLPEGNAQSIDVLVDQFAASHPLNAPTDQTLLGAAKKLLRSKNMLVATSLDSCPGQLRKNLKTILLNQVAFADY
jgi:hypothetical protein